MEESHEQRHHPIAPRITELFNEMKTHAAGAGGWVRMTELFYAPIFEFVKYLLQRLDPTIPPADLHNSCYEHIHQLDGLVNEIRNYFGALTVFVKYFLLKVELTGEEWLGNPTGTLGEVLTIGLPKIVMEFIISTPRWTDEEKKQIYTNISTFVKYVNELGHQIVGIEGSKDETQDERLWHHHHQSTKALNHCLLYTSDAADE